MHNLKELKNIHIGEKTIQYGIEKIDTYQQWWRTIFYEGTHIVEYKKYIFFGPVIKKEEPKQIFDLGYNITDPSFTKDKVKADILKQLELIDRVEQIKRGEII